MIDLKRYYNPVHGLELEPDVNTGDRQNENGILFLVEAIILDQDTSDLKHQRDFDLFDEVMTNIEVEPGLYDRGSLDQQKQDETGIPKRTISHDNLSSIASGSRLLGTDHAKDIATYGVKHGFIYNNRKSGFREPMNPGNYSMWCALADSYLPIQIAFFPIYLANTIICLSKPKEDTSGRLLTFIELYPLRKHWFWGRLYKRVIKSFQKTYGDNPLFEIVKIYFRDGNHPVRLAAKEFKYDT